MSKTIGVFGTGGVNKRAALALVRDFIGDEQDVTLVLPFTATQFTESTKALAEMARNREYPVVAIVDDSEVPADAQEYLEDVDTRVKVTKAAAKVVSMVAGANGTLLLAFDEEDEDTNLAMELAVAKGLRPLDLTDGLQPLFFADEEQPAEEPAPEPEPEPVVEEAPKRTRRPRTPKAEVVDDTPAVLVDEPAAPVVEVVPDEAQQSVPVLTLAPTEVPAAGAVSLVEDAELGRAVKVLLLALAEAQKAVQEPKRGPGRPRKAV